MNRRSKYNAVRTEVDGITFASKKEAKRYSELLLLQKAGVIHDLTLQPKFPLRADGGGKVGDYVADFSYVDTVTGAGVVEDVKGVLTPVYRLKKKMVKAQYGVDIKEI